MSYVAIEVKVQTLLQTLTRFAGHSDAITRGDYSVLDKGLTDMIILEPGAVSLLEPQQTHSGFVHLREREWDVMIDVFRRYDQDGTTETDFATFRDEVVAQIENYPTLDNLTMSDAYRPEYITMSSEGDPEDVFSKDGSGPYFIAQVFRARYREFRDIT